MHSWMRRGLRAVAMVTGSALLLGVAPGHALAAACFESGSGNADIAHVSLDAGQTVTFSSASGFLSYAYNTGGMYNYISAPSPVTVTISSSGSYNLIAYSTDSLNNLTWSHTTTISCSAPATNTQTTANSIANDAAQSTQYVAPKVMSTATTAISTLIGTNVKGAFSRVGGVNQGRGNTTASNFTSATAPEVILAEATDPKKRANAGMGGLKQGLLDGKLGGFAEMSYSHLRSREAGGEYVGDVKNGVAGIDYKIADNFLMGVAVGYEWTDFTTTYNRGWLEGKGATIAPYFGYAFNEFVLDVTLGKSWLNYDTMRGVGGAAYGSYDADREFVTTNLTATYGWRGLRLAPSVGVLFARETAESYRDSTGAQVDEVSSRMGRASIGGEIGQPMTLTDICICSFEPFIKAKLNYDFRHDGRVVLANGQLSAVNDVTGQLGGGVRFNLGRYMAVVLDGSYDTLGATDLEGWNMRGRLDFSLPF